MSAYPEAERDPLRVAVAGAAGRMGRSLVASVVGASDMLLSGATESPGSSHVGQDAGELAGLPALGIAVADNPAEGIDSAQVLIDFSTPEATLACLERAAEQGVAAVVGTTGWSAEQRVRLDAFGDHVPLVFAPNFSTGVAVLGHLLAEAVRLLGEDYDVELMELHHGGKADAPSGTALRLAEIAAAARGGSLEDVVRYERHGRIGPRPDGEVGVQALRGGDAAGEHTVYLLGDGERLELTHRAGSRGAFVRGAMRATRWVVGQPAGLYDLGDVLQG